MVNKIALKGLKVSNLYIFRHKQLYKARKSSFYPKK